MIPLYKNGPESPPPAPPRHPHGVECNLPVDLRFRQKLELPTMLPDHSNGGLLLSPPISVMGSNLYQSLAQSCQNTNSTSRTATGLVALCKAELDCSAILFSAILDLFCDYNNAFSMLGESTSTEKKPKLECSASLSHRQY